MDNYKIKVKDEAESKEIQRLFFAIGFRWGWTQDKEVLRDPVPYLFTQGKNIRYGLSLTDFEKCVGSELTVAELRVLAEAKQPQDPALISGAEALRVLADGKEVEASTECSPTIWEDAANYSANEFLAEETAETEDYCSMKLFFRLKPQTIKLELELPKPFEPEEDCHVYILDDGKTDGYRRYSYEVHGDKGDTFIGIWRTEDEIKQVVEQLRKIRGTNS